MASKASSLTEIKAAGGAEHLAAVVEGGPVYRLAGEVFSTLRAEQPGYLALRADRMPPPAVTERQGVPVGCATAAATGGRSRSPGTSRTRR